MYDKIQMLKKVRRAMKFLKSQKGFTLIELVMVIVILGLLAATAIPKFVDVTDEARAASERAIVGAVRAGIGTYNLNQILKKAKGDTANWHAYPVHLDSIPSGYNNIVSFFGTVLDHGGVQDGNWYKASLHLYEGPNLGDYTYTQNGEQGYPAGSFFYNPSQTQLRP